MNPARKDRTDPPPLPLHLRSTSPRTPPLALRAGPGRAPVADADRRRILESLKAGQEVEMEIDIVAFLQGAEPNRNHTRFTPAAVRKMAKTFEGQPFARDHQESVLARGGTILSSSWEGQEGVGKLLQTVRLSAPWAVEAAARGHLDRFSIHWFSPTPPSCSVCGEAMFSFSSECWHWPGDVVTLKDGTKQTVEAIFDQADGVETSAVLIPAVPGTGVEEVRAALSAGRAGRALGRTKETHMPMFGTIALILGLAAESEDAPVIDAVRKLKGEHDALVLANAQTRDALSAAQKRLDEVEAASRAAELEATIETAYRDGKIAGKREGNAMEASLRALAARDPTSAKAFIASMPQLVPVGKRQSDAPPPPEAKLGELSAAEKKWCKERGVEEATYLKQKAEVYGRRNTKDEDEED